MNSGSRPAGYTSVWPAALGLAALVIAVIAITLGVLRVRHGDTTSVSQSTSADPDAVGVTLIVSGDTAGWIVPCGCTSNQSGGLLRRGSIVSERRKSGAVVVTDAGGAPGGTSEYQRLKFAAILRGELQMGLAAHNLGGPEAALGAAALRRIEAELQVPFVSANLRDAAGALVTESCRIVEIGGRRIALIGVLTASEKIAGCQIDAPRDAVLAALDQIAGRYDRAIVLAWVSEGELRELAGALPEVDAVIGGPTGQALSPQQLGPTLVASATNKGKFLACVQIPADERNHNWSGEIVEVNASFADDQAQVENLNAFRKELALRDFSAGKTGLVPALSADSPADYRIAGSHTCEACHAAEFRAWNESRHAHAWETLQAEKAHVDPECQRCHTTGYGLPGGFESMASSPQHVSVGCESCHGPSLEHTRQPKRKTPLAARAECNRCHDRENSPQFEFADYWPRIIHGTTVNPETRSSDNQ